MLKRLVLPAVIAAVLCFNIPGVKAEPADPYGKYEPGITVHFVRCVDNTLNDNYFAQHPDKTIEDNIWTDLYKGKLGISIAYDWVVKDGDEYEQKLDLAIITGAIPEFCSVSALQMRQLAQADMIMPLDEIYGSYASAFTKEVLAKGGMEPFEIATINGKLYGLPQTATDKEVDYVWIRTDWLQKLGLAKPTTMSELMAVALAFSKADFDGNGIADTYGPVFTSSLWDGFGSLKGFFNAFDAYPNIWVEKNGGLVFGSTLPGAREALAALNKMYESGLIDPGFGVMDASKVAELTTTGHAGIVYGAQWNAIWPLQFNKNADPKAQWQALPIVTATGHEALVQSSTVTNKWTVVKKGAEHPEAVVKMYNLYIDTNWGENNQNSVYYAPIDSESIWKLSPICPEMPNKNIDAFLQLEDARKSGDTSHIKGEALSIQNKLDLFAQGSKEGFALWGWERVYGSEGAYSIYRDYLNSGRIVSDRYTAAPTETMSDFLSTLKAMQNEVFTKIILGDAPIESFDRFVSDFYALGGQRITDEVNSWYRLQTSQ